MRPDTLNSEKSCQVLSKLSTATTIYFSFSSKVFKIHWLYRSLSNRRIVSFSIVISNSTFTQNGRHNQWGKISIFCKEALHFYIKNFGSNSYANSVPLYDLRITHHILRVLS